MIFDQYLHTPHGGITSEKLTAGTSAFELLELAAAAALTPHAIAPAKAEFSGGGGTAGGGGASGTY